MTKITPTQKPTSKKMSNTTTTTEMGIYTEDLAKVLADTFTNYHKWVFDLIWKSQSTFGDYNVAMNRTPMGTEVPFVAASAEDTEGDILEFHFVLFEDSV